MKKYESLESHFKFLLSYYVIKMCSCFVNSQFLPDEEANDAYNALIDFFNAVKDGECVEEKES